MATYYVSTAGSNSNPGTEGSPFLTLDYALSLPALAPGDTIRLGAGTFSNAADTDIHGTAENPITIEGAGVDSTTISGQLTIDKNYYIIKNIKFSTNYLKIGASSASEDASYNIIEYCDFTANSQGVNIHFAGTSPDGTTGQHDNIIRYCNFYAPVGNGMVTINGHDNIVEYCNFTNNRGYDAIRVGGLNHIFRHNIFDSINNPIVVSVVSATCSGGVVTVVTAEPHDIDNGAGVVIAGANETNYNTGASGRVITLISPTSFTYTPAVNPGDGSATGTITAQGANHADVIQAFSSGGYEVHDILFEKNFVIDSSGQLGNLEGESTNTEVTSFHFWNNVIYGSTLQLNIFIPDCTFYNNTVYNTQGTLGVRAIGNTSSRGVANNMRVFNNLFIRAGSSASGGPYSFEPGVSNCEGDYNGMTNGDDGVKTGVTEVHGFNGGYTPDQIFINAADNDFGLKTGGPAIGTATSLSNDFTTDINGNTRFEPWDMGAYVFLVYLSKRLGRRLKLKGRALR
jgi:hypothetical protein